MTAGIARVIVFLILLVAGCPAHGAWAGAPTDQLHAGVDRVFKILKDPDLQGENNTTRRRAAVVKVADEIFDFGEMAKRSLGQHWLQRTPAERGQFVALFTDLIRRAYISKVDQHGAEQMIILGETVDGDLAVVRTSLPLGQGREIPLEYRMHSTDDRWQVYDVSIEGISLVANYRTQFNKIIRTASYNDLITKLQQAELAAPLASPSGGKAVR